MQNLVTEFYLSRKNTSYYICWGRAKGKIQLCICKEYSLKTVMRWKAWGREQTANCLWASVPSRVKMAWQAQCSSILLSFWQCCSGGTKQIQAILTKWPWADAISGTIPASNSLIAPCAGSIAREKCGISAPQQSLVNRTASRTIGRQCKRIRLV